jgi:hypothetical protein
VTEAMYRRTFIAIFGKLPFLFLRPDHALADIGRLP